MDSQEGQGYFQQDIQAQALKEELRQPYLEQEDHDEEDMAETEILNILNTDLVYVEKYQEFINRVKMVTGDQLTGRLDIIDRLIKLFSNKVSAVSNESMNLLGEMEKESLQRTLAYQTLFDQIDLLKEAEERISSILDLLDQQNALAKMIDFEGVKLKNLKLRVVLGESNKRISLERIMKELVFIERLPKNGIFSSISTSHSNRIKQCLEKANEIDFIRSKIDEIKSLRLKVAQFYEVYPKSEFKRLAFRRPEDLETANIKYKEMLLDYVKLNIRDEQLESNFWCLETAFKAGLILGKRRRIEIPIIEKLCKSLESHDMDEFNLLSELQDKIQISQRIEKWAKKIKAGSIVDYNEVKRALEEYQEMCSNILLDGSYEYVQKNVQTLDDVLEKLKEPLAINQLKNLESKIKHIPILNAKIARTIQQRLKRGEDFVLRIKGMSESEICQNFAELKYTYDNCMIKIDRFDELAALRDREYYFVQNVESMVKDNSSNESLRQMRLKVQKFKMCKWCEVELFLLNTEIENLKVEFEMILEGRDFFDARETFFVRHSLAARDLQQFEGELMRLREELKEEISLQKDTHNLREIRPEIMEREFKKVKTHLIFLRSLLKGLDITAENSAAFNLQSGKTSVFEKNLDNYLESYRIKSLKPKGQPQAVGNKYDKNPKSETEQRSFAVSKLRRLLERVNILKIEPADVPYIAKSVEQGIFCKLIEKNMYLQVMARVLGVIREIRDKNYLEIARFLRKQDYSAKAFLKLSQKPNDFLKMMNSKLVAAKQEHRKTKFSTKYLAPFDGDELQTKKIKKRPKKNEGTKKVPVVPRKEFDEDFNSLDQRSSQSIKQNAGLKKRDMNVSQDEYKIQKNAIKPTSTSNYHYFRIFDGSFNLALNSGKKKSEMSLYTCVGIEFVRYFSSIPQKTTLSSKLTRREFIDYIDKALLKEQQNYLVLPGFIKSSICMALCNEMRNNKFVMSMQYTKKSKIFVMPKEFLESQWLDTLNVVIIKDQESKVDLVFFLVLKLASPEKDQAIEPVPFKLLEDDKPYLLKRTIDKVIETEIGVEKTVRISDSAKMLKKRKPMTNSTIDPSQSKDDSYKNSVSKKFDFDEEIKKITVRDRGDMKFSSEYAGVNNVMHQDTKSKLGKLFQHQETSGRNQANQNLKNHDTTDFRQKLKSRDQEFIAEESGIMGRRTDRGFYDEMAFGSSKFENSDNKFEGMFKNQEGSDDDQERLNTHLLQRSNLPKKTLDQNAEFSEEDGVVAGNYGFLNASGSLGGVGFIDNFNAIMDQQMVSLGEDMGIENQALSTGQFPGMSTLQGFENTDLNAVDSYPINSSKRINNFTIEEPFSNISNTYDQSSYIIQKQPHLNDQSNKNFENYESTFAQFSSMDFAPETKILDLDALKIDQNSAKSNIQNVFFIRSYSTIIAGLVAGIFGVGSLTGLGIYFLNFIVVSFLLSTQINDSHYVKKMGNPAWTGVMSELTTYLMIWVIAYNLVHIC